MNYRQLRNPFTPQTVFSDDETASLHATALRVLQELGIKILLPEARKLLGAAGALVDDDMVRIGADMVAAALATAPASIPMRAANPARNQIYENGALIFSAAGGCPMYQTRPVVAAPAIWSALSMRSSSSKVSM